MVIEGCAIAGRRYTAAAARAIATDMTEGHLSRMPMRTRKLIGTLAMIALVSVWALLVMALAQVLAVSSSRTLEFTYYAFAGVGWILPAMPLISWMSKSGD
jgi:hypothetical protein